jgi:hypothetical protein
MQNKLTVYLFPALLLSFHFSFSQIITIDRTDTSAYRKEAVWSGNVALALEIDKQSTTLFDASNFLDVSLQKNKELLIGSASNRFTNDGSTSFLNTGYVHLRWRHSYKDKLHPETFTQYQWDAQRGMVYRYLAGGNLRYNFWHRRKWEMTFGEGAFYENEQWNYTAVDSLKIPPQPIDQKVSRLRSNSYIKWEGSPSPNSDFAAVVFYQASYSDFFRPRVSVRINFDVSVSKHFSLAVAYNGLYDAKPVVPIFNYYYNLSSGVAYKF